MTPPLCLYSINQVGSNLDNTSVEKKKWESFRIKSFREHRDRRFYVPPMPPLIVVFRPIDCALNIDVSSDYQIFVLHYKVAVCRRPIDSDSLPTVERRNVHERLHIFESIYPERLTLIELRSIRSSDLKSSTKDAN